jgi:hypothetical protein
VARKKGAGAVCWEKNQMRQLWAVLAGTAARLEGGRKGRRSAAVTHEAIRRPRPAYERQISMR